MLKDVDRHAVTLECCSQRTIARGRHFNESAQSLQAHPKEEEVHLGPLFLQSVGDEKEIDVGQILGLHEREN